MNVIFISPNFPSSFYLLCQHMYDNSTVHFLVGMPADHPYVEIYNRKRIGVCDGQGACENEDRQTVGLLKDSFEQTRIHALVDFLGYDVNHDWPWWKNRSGIFCRGC